MPIIGVPNPADGNDFDKQDFIDAMSTQIPHVLDDPGDVWVEHAVLSQPTWIFVSADGSVERFTSGLGPQRLVDRLEGLAS